MVIDKTDDAERCHQDTCKNKDKACRDPEKCKNNDNGNRKRNDNPLHRVNCLLLL